jgi:predicted membrane-bound spermidine synthase
VPRSAALLLTLVTGATGLIYEVAWQRYLATLLGSHAEATAAVLGLFLAGLSGGYALFGAVSRRAASVLRVYGLVEAGIGVWALLFPLSFAAVQALSLALPASGSALTFAADVCFAALLVLPPTLLMGGTIPLLTQGLSRDLADATRFHALVYACNTAGACLGALAAGFVLLPAFGLSAVMLAMGALNVAVGAGFVALGGSGPSSAPVPSAGAAPPAMASLIAIALLAGFAMMAIQTVLNRIAGLAFGSSPYTFSLVVALFVSCIALGSAAVSRLPRIPERLLASCLGLLLGWFVLLHALLDLAPFLGHALRLPLGRGALSFYAYQAGAFAVLLLAVGPGVVLSGATLPLLFHQAKRAQADLGRVAGSLYAWNTVGSLLGALVGGHLLLVWLDLDGVLRAALGALAVALALALGLGSGRRLPAGAALAGALGLVLALPGWDARALSSGFFRAHSRLEAKRYTPGAVLDWYYQDRALLFYDDDPVASVAVHEFYYEGVKQRAILSNGKPDGSTRGDYATQALLALLPALLSDRLERVFVVGYGTGVTAGELAALDGTREIVVAEISSAVLAADLFFASANLRAAASPKLRLLRSDAYRALLRSESRFDAIVSEPSNPWMAGIEMLYSREFLAAARSRLAPGGAYVQWFHTYESDDATLALVLRTFVSVFPDTAVWYSLGGDLLLVGFAEPRPARSPAELAARMARADLAAGLRRAGIENATELAAHELLPPGVLEAMALEGPVHTLLHPRLTYRAARAFFTAGRSRLPPPATPAARAVGAERSLMRQLAAAEGGALSDASYAALTDEACEHMADVCVAFLADWLRARPTSRLLAARLARWRATPHGEPIPGADVRDYAALLAGRSTVPPERASALSQRYAHPAVLPAPGAR